MWGQRSLTKFAALSLICATAACSGASTDQGSDAPAENQGFRWVGSGPQGNFGSAYSFCRSTVSEESEGQRYLGGRGPVTSTPGGPANIPGYLQGSQGVRSDYSDRRQFFGCMESQGWAVGEASPPASAAQPTPSSPAPAPSK